MSPRRYSLLLALATTGRLAGGRCFSVASSAEGNHSWLSVRGNPLVKWPLPHPLGDENPSTSPTPITNPERNNPQRDFSTVCNLLRDPNLRPGPILEDALDRTGIEPDPSLLRTVFESFESSPKLLHTLFLWAEKKGGFLCTLTLFDSVVNALGKARDFESAWSLILDRIGEKEGTCPVSADTFAILIRRYNRAGMPEAAIRTFEYAINLDFVCNSDGRISFFEHLLNSLCKEGHVRVAAECVCRKKESDTCWVPSIRVYNILLDGWFRLRKLKHAERLWSEMRRENVVRTVVTYGTLIQGYCRMRHIEKAMDLFIEMGREGIEPNAIVYNLIIHALAEEGRFKEASGMMERFLLCESGPTIATYNSLVKGYCKAKDLVGASKILKMMISRGIPPTVMTYNYFFKHFSKFGMIEEGMNLYAKMIESGYTPDRFTYHLLLKMLCEEEKLDFAIQVSNEMKSRGFDADLATSTMLTHLLCKMRRFKEAFSEFEEMIRRGIVPQYLTFQKLNDELRKQGMTELAQKLCTMMSSVPHSTNLPSTYNVDRDSSQGAKRKSILQKAEIMSEMLKTCNDPKELIRRRKSANPVLNANQLIGDVKRRVNKT